MSKVRAVFACQECGYQSAKWMGRCPQCAKWNTLVEERPTTAADSQPRYASTAQPGQPVSITLAVHEETQRIESGIGELDRLLGGGIVPGSIILLGGDPGIGKSTLALQALARLARQGETLYVSGEESPAQIRLRAQRLDALAEKLMLLAETRVDTIAATIRQRRPLLTVIDSIQTLVDPELTGAPGTVGQVRECSARLMATAKESRVPILLIGHITKDGSIAGPKTLEHLVDAVLYFEGDRGLDLRLLRVIKNRFGPTGELALFEMSREGLAPVNDPSAWFLTGRPLGVSGSAVTVSMEGARPVMIEAQALVSPTYIEGMIPRRVTTGVDPNRVSLLVAVLEKRSGLRLSGADIFVKVSGGARLDEPASDLALAAALVSSTLDRPLPPEACYIGEIGLAGDIRPVNRLEARSAEASRLGFRQLVTAPSPDRPTDKPRPAPVDKPIARVEFNRVIDFIRSLQSS